MTRKTELRKATAQQPYTLKRPEPKKPATFKFTDWAMI